MGPFFENFTSQFTCLVSWHGIWFFVMATQVNSTPNHLSISYRLDFIGFCFWCFWQQHRQQEVRHIWTFQNIDRNILCFTQKLVHRQIKIITSFLCDVLFWLIFLSSHMQLQLACKVTWRRRKTWSSLLLESLKLKSNRRNENRTEGTLVSFKFGTQKTALAFGEIGFHPVNFVLPRAHWHLWTHENVLR